MEVITRKKDIPEVEDTTVSACDHARASPRRQRRTVVVVCRRNMWVAKTVCACMYVPPRW